MTERPTTPAEQITALLTELHGEVKTREKVPHYKPVRRAHDRAVLTLDWVEHRTTAPGLLDQLGVIATTSRPGIVIPGAAVPGGSPGWDADGALTPIVRGGKPDAEEPIAEAWHVAQHIRAELTQLNRHLWEQGYRPPATYITIALDNPSLGEHIARRLRSLVAQARIAADYDAPITTMRDYHCPDCRGPLRVRSDASSDVYCAGIVHGPRQAGEQWPPARGCGARWPRYEWVNLLAAQEGA